MNMTTKQEKAKRMEIRKKTGSRIIRPPQPRTKGGGSLEAHACFKCRISFKVEVRDGIAPCPNCRTALTPMGRSFKAPRKSDTMQWRKVEKLILAGIKFPTTGDILYRPKYPREADGFIKSYREAIQKTHRDNIKAFHKDQKKSIRKSNNR